MSKYAKYKKVNEKWVDEIPAHWEMKRLKGIFALRSEKNNPVKTDRILSLTAKQGVIPYEEKDSMGGNKPKADLTKYNVCHVNDLLVNCMNVVSGSAGVSKYEGAISPVYYALYPHKNDNVWYYHHIFRLDPFQKSLVGLGKGILMHESEEGKLTSVRMRISMDYLGNVMLPVPPREEQDKIAKFLDWKISQIIKLSYKLMEKNKHLIELKRTIITKLMFENRFDDSNYQTRRLKYMLKSKLQYGANATGVTCDENLPRYIRITDIDNNNALKYDNMQSLPIDKSQSYILQDGDILFARSGATAGKTFLYKNEYGQSAFAGYLIRAQVDETVCLPEYVYLMTLSKYYQDWKDSIFIQTTIQNISADKYYNFLIKFPNIKEQIKIIKDVKNQCSNIDILISKNKQRMYEIELIKQRIINDAVTGKINVQNIDVPEYVSQNEINLDSVSYDEENEDIEEVDE